MHLKRQKIPRNWPIRRKGTVYVVKPNFSTKNGLPILIILRDILKIAQNRKEVKRAIHLKQILLNNKRVVDEKNSALLFDILTIIPLKSKNKTQRKHYRLEISNKGKFKFKELKESEANNKISKIINKTTLKGKKTQLNLNDGRNFISDLKCKVNDSVLINFKEKTKIEKCLPLKEKAKAIIISGKHSGEKGTIESLNKENKSAELKLDDKKIHVLIKQLIILE